MNRLPTFACLDLDCFFASVERLLDPSLVGRPLVVGATGSRGVVTAASYEVRAYGVHAGMPAARARRLAPHAIFVPTRSGVYSTYTQQVRQLIERVTPVVKTASIDEFYLDFRGCEEMHRIGDPARGFEDVCDRLRASIAENLGLPSSIGLAATPTLAKMATRDAKPNGTYMVRAGREFEYASGLDVARFPGIGPVAQSHLRARGIHTLGQLLAAPAHASIARVRTRVRRAITPGRHTIGADRPAFREHDPAGGLQGGLSNERTFHSDQTSFDDMHRHLRQLAERVCWRARKRQASARTITLKYRTHTFRTFTRSASVAPTHDESRVLAVCEALLRTHWDGCTPLRLLGISLSRLESVGRQVELPWRQRSRAPVAGAIDAVRERFGYDAVRLGSPSGRR